MRYPVRSKLLLDKIKCCRHFTRKILSADHHSLLNAELEKRFDVNALGERRKPVGRKEHLCNFLELLSIKGNCRSVILHKRLPVKDHHLSKLLLR